MNINEYFWRIKNTTKVDGLLTKMQDMQSNSKIVLVSAYSSPNLIISFDI